MLRKVIVPPLFRALGRRWRGGRGVREEIMKRLGALQPKELKEKMFWEVLEVQLCGLQSQSLGSTDLDFFKKIPLTLSLADDRLGTHVYNRRITHDYNCELVQCTLYKLFGAILRARRNEICAQEKSEPP